MSNRPIRLQVPYPTIHGPCYDLVRFRTFVEGEDVMMILAVSWRPERTPMSMPIRSLPVEQVCSPVWSHDLSFRMVYVGPRLRCWALPHTGVYVLDGVISNLQFPGQGLQVLMGVRLRQRSLNLEPSSLL